MYNLAEQLEFRIELDTAAEMFSLRKAPDGAALAFDYEITDIYLMGDTLTATSGGVLNDTPFRWHDYGVYSRQDKFAVGKGTKLNIPYDLKKTSMKDFTSMMLTAQTNTAQPFENCRSIPCPLSYRFTMGGTPFPIETAVSDKHEQWYYFLKFWHRQDITGDVYPYVVRFGRFENDGATATAFGCFWPCLSFEKLDQANWVSGPDTSRYTVIGEFERVEDGPADNDRFYTWLRWDKFYNIIGGEVIGEK